MLPGGLNRMYRDSLGTSHEPYLLLEVLDGQQQVIETVPLDPTGGTGADVTYMGGSVDATLVSRISRTCTVTLHEDLYPYEPDALFAPYGNMLRAWRGIQYADGTYFRWVVFVGRIQDAVLNDNGTCTVQADDFAADVLENRFVRPQNSQPDSTISQEVERLISDGFPQAQFAYLQPFAQLVRPRVWQLDRGQALDELATSVGAFWYPQADGQFVLRQYPWTVAGTPVVTYSDKDPGGSVAGSRAARSRSTVSNSLTVAGERLNGDKPVYALAQDDNPDSPTFVGNSTIPSQFGRRHQLLRLQTPSSQGAAQGAANDNLRRSISLADVWAWSMSVDAALELGDTVLLDVRGRTGIEQVVASMQIPLDLSGLMQVTGRSRVSGFLQEGE